MIYAFQAGPIPITNSFEFLAWLLPFLALAGGQLYSWYDNRERMRAAAGKTAEVRSNVEALGVTIDGRVADLVRAARQIGYIEGRSEGIAIERAIAATLRSNQDAAAVTALAVTVAATRVEADRRREGEGAGHS